MIENEMMFGNDNTGEVVCITNAKAGVFEISQIRAPEGSQHVENPVMGNLLLRTTSHKRAQEYWADYKSTRPGFVKLIKHSITAEATEVEMSTEPVPLALPYTESSFQDMIPNE